MSTDSLPILIDNPDREKDRQNDILTAPQAEQKCFLPEPSCILGHVAAEPHDDSAKDRHAFPTLAQFGLDVGVIGFGVGHAKFTGLLFDDPSPFSQDF